MQKLENEIKQMILFYSTEFLQAHFRPLSQNFEQ